MSVAKRMDKGVSRVGVSSGWTVDATFGLHSSEYIALPALKGMDGKTICLFLIQIITTMVEMKF